MLSPQDLYIGSWMQYTPKFLRGNLEARAKEGWVLQVLPTQAFTCSLQMLLCFHHQCLGSSAYSFRD